MMENRSTKSLALRLVVVLFLLVVAAGFRAGPASAKVMDNVIEPYDIYVDNDCTGEEVHLTGELHVLFFEIENEAGGFVYRLLAHPVNVTGVGMTTGAVYRGVGMTQDIGTVSPNAQTYNYTNQYSMIAQGSALNFIVHEVFHITFDGSGNPVVVVEHGFTECR